MPPSTPAQRRPLPRRRRPLALALGLAVALSLAACSTANTDGPTPKAAPSSSAAPATADAAAQPTDTATPTATATATATPDALDLSSNQQWQAGCILPLSQVAGIAAQAGMHLTAESDESNGDGIDCGYQDPATSYGIDVQIFGYGPSSEGYGFLTDGDGGWQAPGPAAGYANACASKPETNDGPTLCTKASGSGIASNWGNAVVFPPGRYFYVIGADGIGQDADVGAVLVQVAKALAASDARPR